MTLPEALAIGAAGLGAGAINTVVGSGTLLTFPVLLGFGYSPVVANVSNTVGLVPGGIAGTHGYRRELSGQGRRAVKLGVASLLGGVTGATLLLVLPGSAFKAIVPFFIAVAVVLVAVQPRITARLEERRREGAPHGHWWTLPGIYAIGMYGGFFGAAQGILLLAVLSLSLTETLQRINGMKNVLATLTNLVAALLFMVAANIDWRVAGLLGAGSVVGGVIGARVGRRLRPGALRLVIVAVGIAAIAKLVF